MKHLAKSLGAVLLAALLAFSLPAMAAASTVNVDGYDGEAGQSQFTISGVLEKSAEDYFDGVPTYYCSAPAVVTTTVDLAEYIVAPVKAVDDTWEEGTPLSVDGTCVVYDADFNEKTLSCKEADQTQEYIISSYNSGAKVSISAPGTYHIMARHASFDEYAEAVVIIKGEPAPASVKALPTSAKVLVNGKATTFEAYGINGNNYFKLRDLAKVVSGTKKQFDVTWDASKNAINLKSGKAYTVAGGELAKGDGKEKTAAPCKSTIYMDGTAVSLTAYTINGNNYFKLRDVARIFDIGVTWDGKTSTVGIDTNLSYQD